MQITAEPAQLRSSDFAQFKIRCTERLVWILTQAVFKNIEPSIFYERFTESPYNEHSIRMGSGELITQEWLDWLSWNFCGHIFRSVRPTIKFSSEKMEPLEFYELPNRSKNPCFRQVWYFVSYDWDEIEVWTFHWIWNLYRCIFTENFSPVNRSFRSGESFQKWVFDANQASRKGYLPRNRAVWESTCRSWKYYLCPTTSKESHHGIYRKSLQQRLSLWAHMG
jgi:hypothetical protein